MKKFIIAAGAASVALAAMPIVGVFAANTTYSTIKDVVNLTVDSSCTMEADDALVVTDTTNSLKGTVVNLPQVSAGDSVSSDGTGTLMTVNCNSVKGWTLSAIATDMTTTSGPTYTIPFGNHAATGQTASVWSAKIALTGAGTSPVRAEVINDADDYANTSVNTSSATVIAQNTTDTSVTPNKPYGVSGLEITPSYTAHAATDQEAGSYSGTITYTFTEKP